VRYRIAVAHPGAGCVGARVYGPHARSGQRGRGGRALHKGLRPGRFFVAIRSRDNSTAGYTLLRASRTITTSRVRVNGAVSTILAPRTPATISVLTRPPVDGPVTVTLEQFDPLAGWQFVRTLQATASGGAASVLLLALPQALRGSPNPLPAPRSSSPRPP
jgi:hypothetical protein